MNGIRNPPFFKDDPCCVGELKENKKGSAEIPSSPQSLHIGTFW